MPYFLPKELWGGLSGVAPGLSALGQGAGNWFNPEAYAGREQIYDWNRWWDDVMGKWLPTAPGAMKRMYPQMFYDPNNPFTYSRVPFAYNEQGTRMPNVSGNAATMWPQATGTESPRTKQIKTYVNQLKMALPTASEEQKRTINGFIQLLELLASEKGYERGGPVDSIPALLAPGEYVLNPKAVETFGRENLDTLNFKVAPAKEASTNPIGRGEGGYEGGLRDTEYERRLLKKFGEKERGSIREFLSTHGAGAIASNLEDAYLIWKAAQKFNPIARDLQRARNPYLDIALKALEKVGQEPSISERDPNKPMAWESNRQTVEAAPSEFQILSGLVTQNYPVTFPPPQDINKRTTGPMKEPVAEVAERYGQQVVGPWTTTPGEQGYNTLSVPTVGAAAASVPPAPSPPPVLSQRKEEPKTVRPEIYDILRPVLPGGSLPAPTATEPTPPIAEPPAALAQQQPFIGLRDFGQGPNIDWGAMAGKTPEEALSLLSRYAATQAIAPRLTWQNPLGRQGVAMESLLGQYKGAMEPMKTAADISYNKALARESTGRAAQQESLNTINQQLDKQNVRLLAAVGEYNTLQEDLKAKQLQNELSRKLALAGLDVKSVDADIKQKLSLAGYYDRMPGKEGSGSAAYLGGIDSLTAQRMWDAYNKEAVDKRTEMSALSARKGKPGWTEADDRQLALATAYSYIVNNPTVLLEEPLTAIAAVKSYLQTYQTLGKKGKQFISDDEITSALTTMQNNFGVRQWIMLMSATNPMFQQIYGRTTNTTPGAQTKAAVGNLFKE